MTLIDRRMMARALQLARRGLMTVSPNPAVGCVLAKDTKIVGEGWHIRAGKAHAEINALRDAAENAQGATAYVTLEPCCHQGKTPPCTEALINAGVSRVVYAMQDCNPMVSGIGLNRLRKAGIAVEGPLLENEALQLNRGFVKRHTQGLPWVTVKMAMSLDGRTAMASGESQWITGSEARSDVQRLRAENCAIITGINTVLRDNARLTVRKENLELDYPLPDIRQPLRVVLDSQGRLTADSALLAEPGPVLQVIASEKIQPLKASEQLVLPGEQGIDLSGLLHNLAARQCNQVLVEAGATLAGAFVQAGLVDELVIYMAPVLLGSQARPLVELPLNNMDQKVQLKIIDSRTVGTDIRITAAPVYKAPE